MSNPNERGEKRAFAMETAIALLVVLGLLWFCLRILSPFISLILWGGVIAIAIFPMHRKLSSWLRGRNKTSAVLIVLIGFAITVVPLWLFSGSMLDAVTSWRAQIAEGVLSVPPPAEAVRSWPVVGERAYAAWLEASENVSQFLIDHEVQVRNLALEALSRLAGAGLGTLQFLASLIIAAILLVSADKSTAGLRLLIHKLSPRQGEDLRKLTIATTRSVAVGILGIAVIQAVAAGAGIALVGLPASGLWALAVLVLAIAQLPPLLVMLPLSVYVFSIQSTTIAVLFLIWAIIVSFSDGVLKPLLLGRGVDAPMPVILLGAIGGLIGFGIIGLFLGAVLLALGYKLLEVWVTSGEPESNLAAPGAAK